MEIRPYSENDWESVRKIYDLSKPDEMSGSVDLAAVIPIERDASMLALFRESTILVVEETGHVLGFGGYKGNYISWLFVHPNHRRRGVARNLVREILANLDGRITLNVAKNNQAARNLYEGLGFTVEREFRGTFNGQECQVVTFSYEESQ